MRDVRDERKCLLARVERGEEEEEGERKLQ